MLSAINFLENAVSFLDVVCFIPFHLHQLKGKRANSFAIDAPTCRTLVTSVVS